MKFRKFVFLTIHIIFISGLFYDLALFLGTSRESQDVRRLYAYEGWIIGSFYILFIVLTLLSQDYHGKLHTKPREYINKFKKILSIHLLLMIFPWGVFILTAPQKLLDILGIGANWIKVLSMLSITSAFFYYLPFQTHKGRTAYFVMIVGFITTLITAIGLSILFYLHLIPAVVISSIPLLLYCSYFFWEHSRHFGKVLKNNKIKAKSQRK